MKIAVTGSEGYIGDRIMEIMPERHQVIGLDRNGGENTMEIDLAEEDRRLERILDDVEAVIHLAWDTEENFRSELTIQKNKVMAENLFEASLSTGVEKIFLASSIHAAFVPFGRREDLSGEIGPDRVDPDSPYGASKIYLEALARYFATEETRFLSARMGAPSDKPPEGPGKADWLSFEDLVELVENFLRYEGDRKYHQVNAVSDNDERIYSLENNLGWRPVEGA
jgi:nucleoside-diphosphate-sugar epimerase